MLQEKEMLLIWSLFPLLLSSIRRIRLLISSLKILLQKLKQFLMPNLLAIFLQTAENFREYSSEPHKLNGAFFNEDEWLPQAIAVNDLTSRHFLSINKFILAYHFDSDDTLDKYAAEAEKLLAGGPSHQSIAQYYLYCALANLS